MDETGKTPVFVAAQWMHRGQVLRNGHGFEVQRVRRGRLRMAVFAADMTKGSAIGPCGAGCQRTGRAQLSCP